MLSRPLSGDYAGSNPVCPIVKERILVKLKRGFYLRKVDDDYTFIKILKFIRVCNTKRQEYEVTYPHVNAKKIMIHIDFETQKSEFKKVSLFKALLISNKIRKMPISEIWNYLKKLSMGQCCSW